MTWISLFLALFGPGVIALLWRRFASDRAGVAANAPWLGTFILLLAGIAFIAAYGEGLELREIGFEGTSWLSIPFGAALALFFIFVFGPAAYWLLARIGLGSFEAGLASLAALPRWHLGLTIIIVAAGEEWLYRGYAIERLEAMTGSGLLAGALSLAAFGIVHLPLWGIGASLTTLISGGIMTALYLWQRDVAMLMLAHVLTDIYGLIIAQPRQRPHKGGQPPPD